MREKETEYCKHCDMEVLVYVNARYSGSGKYWSDGNNEDMYLYSKIILSRIRRCGECNRKI